MPRRTPRLPRGAPVDREPAPTPAPPAPHTAVLPRRKTQRRPVPRPLEGDVQAAILHYLTIRGWMVLTPETVRRLVEDKTLFDLEMWARAHAGICWRANTSMSTFPRPGGGRTRPIWFGVPGQADILGIAQGGTMIGIECKRPGEKPSPTQRVWLALIAAMGGRVLVAEGLDDVVRWQKSEEA